MSHGGVVVVLGCLEGEDRFPAAPQAFYVGFRVEEID